MKNTIRCCISCILPCGALDVIRIIHSNGRVEEISGSIKASEIMKAHPKHVLKKPSSPSDDGMVPKIVIVPPDAELQRGKIYFLMPVPSTPEKNRSKSSSTTKKKRRDSLDSSNNNNSNSHSQSMSNANKNNNTISMTNLLISDQYLSEILSEKLSTQRDRRRGRVGVWRPHLESISETPNDG
ncbi:ELMO domain-containing protein F-like [Durio zibethinus]|uniref:ELMO domain-containing protein F-like n=1 Tax=Durio zibethinus TaxID=66656 RepID=A0A6P5WYR0_DURZI|nr:ELMO domain-containing protein F-like [Durio zibethinus]